jgi:hypothetical protein
MKYDKFAHAMRSRGVLKAIEERDQRNIPNDLSALVTAGLVLITIGGSPRLTTEGRRWLHG